MKYLSFRAPDGIDSVGIVQGDRVVDVGRGLLPDNLGLSPMRRLLTEHAGALPSALDGVDLPEYSLTEVTVLPVVPDPSKVIAAPVNYLDHKAEMNEDAHIDALGVFLKAPSSLVGDSGTVQLPYTDRRFDQEGELAFVIGRSARNVSAQDADQYIAGYTCLLDMTMRGGEDRSTRKSFDTFTPLGRYLVTPDEVGNVDELRLRTWVNDELRQDADVRDLIWGVAALLEYASSIMTLHAGDVITTGTPAGVGPVSPGDEIEVEITRVGRLSVTISADSAGVCPTRGADRGPKPPTDLTPIRER